MRWSHMVKRDTESKTRPRSSTLRHQIVSSAQGRANFSGVSEQLSFPTFESQHWQCCQVREVARVPAGGRFIPENAGTAGPRSLTTCPNVAHVAVRSIERVTGCLSKYEPAVKRDAQSACVGVRLTRAPVGVKAPGASLGGHGQC